jgi:hypothetical protein
MTEEETLEYAIRAVIRAMTHEDFEKNWADYITV